MNIREVALELTALISHELSIQSAEEIIKVYQKCYKGVEEAESGNFLDE